jgi:hypothetical protein
VGINLLTLFGQPAKEFLSTKSAEFQIFFLSLNPIMVFAQMVFFHFAHLRNETAHLRDGDFRSAACTVALIHTTNTTCLHRTWRKPKSLKRVGHYQNIYSMFRKNLLQILFFSLSVCTFGQSWDNAFNQGGAFNQYGIGTARDASNNRIICGTYNTGSTTLGTITLANAGGYDGFVAKYNTANVIQWAARMSGSDYSVTKSVTTDPSGNIYACGSFRGSCTFYHASGVAFSTLSTPNWDSYLIKYNSAGTIQWLTKVATTTGSDEILNLDYRNSVLAIAGGIGGSVTVSGFPLVQGAYIASINPSTGGIIWIYNCAAGSGGVSAMLTFKNGICIDNNNDIYITGVAANGNVVYGSMSNIPLVTNAPAAAMYAKYTSTGNLLWARVSSQSGTGTATNGLSVAADDIGNVYIGGVTNPTSSPAQILFPTSGAPLGASTSIAGNNCYMGKLDPSNGNALWITTQSAISYIDLSVRTCGVLYAAMLGGTSATIHGTGGGSIVPTNLGTHIAKFYSTGALISASTWDIPASSQSSFINCWNNSVDLTGTFYGSGTVIPLSAGGSTTLTANANDVLAGTFTEINPFPAPSISLNATPAQLCAGDPTTLSATVTGMGGPYTYSWNVYNGATFVPFPGSLNSLTLSLNSADYSPYVYYNPVLNTNICAFQLVVTTCSGATYTATTFFVVYSPITYTPISDQSACLGPDPDDAFFTVSTTNAWGYKWQVSCDGGATWTDCSTSPPPPPSQYLNYNTASLTVHYPMLGMSGCQYRCVLDGNFCPDVTTNAATLTVILGCRLLPPSIDPKNIPEKELAKGFLYPNPANSYFTLSTGSRQTLQVKVINQQGLVVMEQQVVDEQSISTAELVAGIYQVTAKASDGTNYGAMKLVVIR